MRDEFGSPARMSRGDSPATRDVAFVFQQYSLYPHLSVFDNLAFPLRSPARPTPEPTIRQKVNEVAALLRIADKLDQRVTKLSGGEMQRVAIGRALVRSPSVYLMDEPLSSLDAKLRAELRLELKRIQVELGATILYVTHDQIEAMTMASRIGVLRDGRLLAGWDAARNLREPERSSMSRPGSARRRSTCCRPSCCLKHRCRRAPRRSAYARSIC